MALRLKLLRKVESIVKDIEGVISIVDIKGRTHGAIYFYWYYNNRLSELNVKQSHVFL